MGGGGRVGAVIQDTHARTHMMLFFFRFTTAPTPQAPHPLSNVTPTLTLTPPAPRSLTPPLRWPQTCEPLSLSLAPSVPSRLLTQREEPHTHTHKNRSAIHSCHCWWRRALWCMHTVRVKEWKIKTNVLNLFCMTSVGLPSRTTFFFFARVTGVWVLRLN